MRWGLAENAVISLGPAGWCDRRVPDFIGAEASVNIQQGQFPEEGDPFGHSYRYPMPHWVALKLVQLNREARPLGRPTSP